MRYICRLRTLPITKYFVIITRVIFFKVDIFLEKQTSSRCIGSSTL